MKRRDLEIYLRSHGCVLVREGGKHSVFANLKNGEMATLPRHVDVNPFLAKKICKELDVPVLNKR